MRSGAASELPTWEQRTAGSASFSSPLYPTPAASDWKRDDYPADRLRKSPNLPTISRYFKTPTSQLAINGGSQHPDKRKAGGHGPTLADEVEHLLPTPKATDGEKGGPNQRGSSGDRPLPAICHLLPTPTAQAAKHSSDDRGPGTLDDWNLWSIATRIQTGEITPQQSADGNESTDQLPGQLNLLDGMEATA
jgi:hypothetical protein